MRAVLMGLCIGLGISIFSTVSAFFEIAEVLPNTIDDKNLEYITIKNISSKEQSLQGYILADKKKEYQIQDNILLQAGERKEFFRPQTKLVLNNSNEEIFLKSSTKELIDSISYISSIKGESINYEDSTIEEEVDFIPQEANTSEDVLTSDKDQIDPLISETQTPPIHIEKDEVQGNEKLEAPQIVYSLQQPSYIMQISDGKYVCDTDREDCKVNLDVRESFSDDFLERDYNCEINFGIPDYITQQETKCNPNVVIFPKGEFTVKIKIIYEDDISIFSEESFVIQNTQKQEEVTEIIQEFVGETPASTKITENLLQAPNITLLFQQPSYIVEDSENTYRCDSTKSECKVNFDLRPSFSEDFPEKHYFCRIDFGLGIVTGEEEKCNPGTLTFPYGEHILIFQIFHADNTGVFSEKSITLLYSESKPVTTSFLNGETNTDPIETDTIKNKIYISYPRVRVQSGLEGKGRYFSCKHAECKMNLEYKKKHKNEQCFWDFGSGTYESSSTNGRCNPGYVTLPEGDHSLSLKVYEKGNDQNFKKTEFYVNNIPSVVVADTSQVNPAGGIDSEEKQYGRVKAKIRLQGKLSKNKKLEKDSLICMDTERCYVNFDLDMEQEYAGLSYIWKKDRKVFSEKQNPNGTWVEGEGDHTIELIVLESETIVLQESFYIQINNAIAALLPTPVSIPVLENDASGEENIQNNNEAPTTIVFTQNFLPLKYDGLRISGKAPDGTQRVEVYKNGNKIGSSGIDTRGRYRIVSKNISAGENSFDTKFVFNYGQEYIEDSGIYSLDSEKTLLWFPKAPKKQVADIPHIQKKPLEVSFSRGYINGEKQELHMILLFNIGIIVLLFFSVYKVLSGIIRFAKPLTVSFSLLQFSVKQRVVLLID